MIRNQDYPLSYGIYAKSEIEAVARGMGCEAYSHVYGYPVTSIKRLEAKIILDNWDKYNEFMKHIRFNSFKIACELGVDYGIKQGEIQYAIR